ncbi:PAC2 family protein [Rothia endophytica]|uniref:PAC2 family protein n=1 Tax=Rothia endophytica TaxID=1324766 RepID=UPI001F42F1A2|nr:PAC2 family protein [Rothia endophytica]
MHQLIPQDILAQMSARQGSPDDKPLTALLIAFEGWNDAGEASTETLRLISSHYGVSPLPGFETSDYFCYLNTRPMFESFSDGTGAVKWPTITFSEVNLKSPERRLLIVTGPEPSLRWQSFIDNIFSFAQEQGVDLILQCGALLDEVPHSRPFPLNITSMNPDVLAVEGVEKVTYSGPTGIIGVTAHEAAQRGIPVASLWVSVPHYISHPPHPKAVFTLMSALESMLGISLPVDQLAEDILAWERGASELLEEEPELRSYVQQLESSAEAEDDLATFEHMDIAAEFEKFLKRRDDS